MLRLALVTVYLGAGLCAATTTTPVGTPLATPTQSATGTPSPSYVSGIITTIAGNAFQGYNGDGIAGTSAHLYSPSSVALDALGNVYIADSANSRVRKLSLSTGIITTIAGTGANGFSGDGGPATNAMLYQPQSVAADSAGNVYIADGTNRIRMVASSTGVISTIAGNGDFGPYGDGGAATSAELCNPAGVAVDTGGNYVYVADTYCNRVRKVSLSTGVITTVAGNSSDTNGFSGDGGPGTAAQFYYPSDLAVDVRGNVYIADTENNRVRLWNASSGVVTTIAGPGNFGVSGDGGAGTNAWLYYPRGVAVDPAGNVYIADSVRFSIRLLAANTNVITTVAGTGSFGFSGDGGPGTQATLYNPLGVAVGAVGGAVYIADTLNGRIRMLSAAVISPTRTPAPTPTPSSTPYCLPSHYRGLPRMDLVGSLVGSALFPGADVLTTDEGACRQACCDAPVCNAYSFAAATLRSSATGTASCFLFVNVTALVPSNGMSSGVLYSVYT